MKGRAFDLACFLIDKRVRQAGKEWAGCPKLEAAGEVELAFLKLCDLSFTLEGEEGVCGCSNSYGNRLHTLQSLLFPPPSLNHSLIVSDTHASSDPTTFLRKS